MMVFQCDTGWYCCPNGDAEPIGPFHCSQAAAQAAFNYNKWRQVRRHVLLRA
jgi:hypothetical protein